MIRTSPPGAAPTGRVPRAPLHVRKTSDRARARRRIAARTTAALTPAQRAFNPLARERTTTLRRTAIAILAIAASLGVHAALVGGALWSRSSGRRPTHEEVTVQVRQREPEPEKKPEPPAPVERPTRQPPKVAKAPPPAPPPIAPPKAKPVRVVGLSLESTSGEGGDGPAFAAGNTRMGETATKAVAPADISGSPNGEPKAAAAAGTGNKLASRLPVAGVKYVPPKRKHPKQPPYPATLKSQGIEGDVMVLVSLDPTGKVKDVKIIKGSPYPEFDEAARTAALAEEFEPAMRDDVPIPYSLSYTYRFRLEDE